MCTNNVVYNSQPYVLTKSTCDIPLYFSTVAYTWNTTRKNNPFNLYNTYFDFLCSLELNYHIVGPIGPPEEGGSPPMAARGRPPGAAGLAERLSGLAARLCLQRARRGYGGPWSAVDRRRCEAATGHGWAWPRP